MQAALEVENADMRAALEMENADAKASMQREKDDMRASMEKEMDDERASMEASMAHVAEEHKSAIGALKLEAEGTRRLSRCLLFFVSVIK